MVGLVVPVPLLGLSLLVDGPGAVADGIAAFGWQAGLSTLYTAGLASLVGYGIFNTLLARNPSAAVVPWVLLAPVVAMASAWVLLGERPNGPRPPVACCWSPGCWWRYARPDSV